MSDRLDWERDGSDWPNRAFSRFVSAAGVRWHVQVMGEGPVVLLLHGTGAASHSFRTLAPLLAPHFTVVVPDLPGHGFTGPPPSESGYALPNVARALTALLDVLSLQPVLLAGHSAGAAVAVRICLDGAPSPTAVVSLNGALLPFLGMANDIFGPAARLLASSSITAKAFSLFAGARPSVERMMRSTGSHIDAEGMRLYARLAGNSRHVHGALALMAHWNLRRLAHELPRLRQRLILLTGSQDGMVPPSESYRVRALLPTAELISLRGLGHLAHEEKPEQVATLLQQMAPHAVAG